MELPAGSRRGRTGEKVLGIRSINGRYNIDRRRLRIVWEMEKPKHLAYFLNSKMHPGLRGGKWAEPTPLLPGAPHTHTRQATSGL